MGLKEPDRTILSQTLINEFENSPGSIPQALHPPTPSATPENRINNKHNVLSNIQGTTYTNKKVELKRLSS